jgi:hypothetical protein
MKDETWGALAWWITTILKWTFCVAGVLVLLQLLYIAIGGHAPIWVLLPLWRN